MKYIFTPLTPLIKGGTVSHQLAKCCKQQSKNLWFVALFLTSFLLVSGLTGLLGAKDILPVVAQTPTEVTTPQTPTEVTTPQTPTEVTTPQTPTEVTTPQTATDPDALVQEAKKLYQNQKYSEALPLLEQAATAFAARKDVPKQAMALDLQGQVYLALGQGEKAADSFSLAATTYEQGGDKTGAIKSRLNQAQALRQAGLYRLALDTLKQLEANLTEQTDPLLRTIAKRSLGITQRLIGELEDAQKSIEESLKIAETLPSPAREENVSAAYLMLGNIAKDQRNKTKAQTDLEQAIENYKKAAETAITPTAKVEAQLNQLSVFGDSGQPLTDTERQLLSEIRQTLDQLPLSRTGIHARINWARMMMEYNNEENVNAQDIAQQLAIALEQSRQLKDSRSESYALGQLGELRQQLKQLQQAQENTQQALAIAQSIGASDIAYRWQWQLAEILKDQGKTEGAIVSYEAAVNNLQSIRGDLVSVNPDAQFSFRKSVEPVYREYAGLLLQSNGNKSNPENLEKARKVIESLQQAELVNFFRENCLTANPVKIDDIDQKAVVIYPIVLADRLEVVMSLPGDRFEHHSVPVPRVEMQGIFTELRQSIVPSSNNRGLGAVARDEGDTQPNEVADNETVYLKLGKQAYDWLIRPFEDEIQASGVQTLVFVLDGPMLNLPMAVLHDGEKFLIEKYAIAQTPGLQLLKSKPLKPGELTVLKGGISEARTVPLSNSKQKDISFIALPSVERELKEISEEVKGQVLLNDKFTKAAIQQAIDAVPFPVVHLATHGQFSSKAEETFILTWDGVLPVTELGSVLRGREESGTEALELLVLSACETAAGDERAALGLAGVAVRAGARSTIATLWPVDDQATADLMIQFYEELKNPENSKAEALRRAQVWLMQKDSKYKSPRYWAPFILVGNWL